METIKKYNLCTFADVANVSFRQEAFYMNKRTRASRQLLQGMS